MSDSDYDSPLSDEEFDDLEGLLLNGRYLMIDVIGDGAFSIVWLCCDLKHKGDNKFEFYAMKVQNTEDEDAAKEEMSILLQLKNISDSKQKLKGSKIKLSTDQCMSKMVDHFTFENFNCEKQLCMVFEIMDGSIYDNFIKPNKKENLMNNIGNNIKAKLSFQDSVIIVHQTLKALSLLIKQMKMMHTDIKPENILFKYEKSKYDNLIKKTNSKEFIAFYKKNTKKYNKLATKIKKMAKDSKSCENSIINKVVLSDFGNCRDISSNYDNIQTRYYKAPEVILLSNFDHRVDVWSIGCLLYEIIFNEVLFFPEYNDKISKDRDHIKKIIEITGFFPEKMLKESKRKSVFFKKNGLPKQPDDYSLTNIEELIHSKIKEHTVDMTNDQTKNLIDFLELTLNNDNLNRKYVDDCISHPIFCCNVNES